MEAGNENIAKAILSLPLIQIMQLPVMAKGCVNLCLSLPMKSVVRLTDHLSMTIVVDWVVQQQSKQAKQISQQILK